MQTHEIIIALAPVFLMIFLGWFTRYFLFSESIKWRLIEKVTYYLFVPALVIKHLLYVDLENIQITNALLTLFATIFTVSLILLFSRKKIKKHFSISDQSFTSIFQGSIRANFFISLAAAPVLLGNNLAALLVILVAIFTITVNFISVLVLVRFGSEKKRDLNHIALKLLRNPFILSTVVGIAINLSGIDLAEEINSGIALLSGLGLPMALFCAGASIYAINFRRQFSSILLASSIRLIISPFIAYMIGKVLGLDGQIIATLVLFHGQPTAVTSYILAREMDGDHELMASILTSQTALSVISLPIILLLLT